MTDDQAKNLRQRAQDILHGKPVNVEALTPPEIERLFYELQLHEVELQLQNEELRAAQRQLETSRRKYADLYDFAPVGYLTLNEDGLVEEANLTATNMLAIGREQLFRQPFTRRVANGHLRTYVDHQRRLLATQAHQRDELQLVKGDGTLFYAQLDSTLVMPDEGEPARHHLVIADISRRKQIEVEEYEQRIFAESLSTISSALNSTLDLDHVLALILDHVNFVVRHDLAEVLLFEGDIATVVGSTVHPPDHTGRDVPDDSDQTAQPIHKAPHLARMVRAGQPVLMADIRAEPRWRSTFTHQRLHAYIGAPIKLKQQVIGCLNVFNQTPGFYTQTHAGRLQAFADQTATAINNARLHRQAQDAAAWRERQRLARDLHDAVSQSLFSASMIAEALPQLSQRSPDALAQNLEKLLTLTRGAMAEMRALLLELRPESLARYTLAELLQQLVEAVQARRQMTVHMHLNSDLELPHDVKEVIYRVAQEALNNVIKHAQASEVTIQLDRAARQLELSIRDDGCGFDTRQETAGIGLYSMRERTQTIDATLTVDSVPDQGTVVSLVWSAPA